MPRGEVSSHVWIDSENVAWIDQTNVKVIEVVCDYLAYRWTAEEMHLHQPHLSIGQIHAAMAHYYDHQKDFDSEIQRSLKEVDALQERFEDKALKAKLSRAKRGE
jgi:hypothetical protein